MPKCSLESQNSDYQLSGKHVRKTQFVQQEHNPSYSHPDLMKATLVQTIITLIVPKTQRSTWYIWSDCISAQIHS